MEVDFYNTVLKYLSLTGGCIWQGNAITNYILYLSTHLGRQVYVHNRMTIVKREVCHSKYVNISNTIMLVHFSWRSKYSPYYILKVYSVTYIYTFLKQVDSFYVATFRTVQCKCIMSCKRSLCCVSYVMTYFWLGLIQFPYFASFLIVSTLLCKFPLTQLKHWRSRQRLWNWLCAI